MSTICKICVNAGQDDVALWIREFLASRDASFEESTSEWPLSSDRDRFNPDYSFPSVLSLKQVMDSLSEIYYNSFGDVGPLAATISQKFGGPVVVNAWQSTAMAGEWALFSGGALRRKVTTEGGEVTAEAGDPLEFEGAHTGRNIAEEEDDAPIYAFDDTDMSAYNSDVGIGVGVYHDGGSGWTNFVVVSPADPLLPNRHRVN